MYTKHITAFLLLGCLFVAAGCVPLPDSQDAAPIEAPVSTVLSGIVTYGGQPAPGAQITLRIPGWQTDPAGMTVAETTANADGRFTFENAPVGEYSIIGVFADGEEDSGGWPQVIIEAGQDITDVIVPLERALTLVEPAPGAQTGVTPTLAWQPFTEAEEGYRMLLIDAGTTELLLDVYLDQTQVLTPPLTPGRTYTWVVQALGKDRVLLAESTAEFTVAADASIS